MRLVAVSLFALTLGVGAIAGPPPLTGRDAGLYVGSFADYLLGPSPFAFSIEQAGLDSDAAEVRRRIEGLHANGKRVILDIWLYKTYDEAARPASEYMADLDRLLSQLPLDQLYAITLAEENIYWNGHGEMLADLYHLVKAKYPALAVYQWYSPGASPPGFGWPLLPADGWLVDEYCKPGAQFEDLVQKYVVLDKPLIHIAWAAPHWESFQGWDLVWDDQLEICRRYGVPISFFCWWPKGNTPPPPDNKSTWSWCAPPGTEHHRVWNRMVLPYVQRLRRGLVSAHDPNRSVGRAIPVAGDEQGQFSYAENFAAAPRFMDDADIGGFLGLRWTGERLELKRDQPVTLTYRFESPFTVHDVQARARGAERLGAVTLGVSADGKTWVTPTRPCASLKATLPQPSAGQLQRFCVRVTLSPGHGTAALENLTVTARVDPPAVPQVTLRPDRSGAVSFRDDFLSSQYLHAGRLMNAQEIKWLPGSLRMFGKQGYVNDATVDYHFVCARPLTDVQARLTCAADRANWGAAVALGISADGESFADMVTTGAGPEPSFSGDLTARSWSAPGGSREFWLRIRMTNNCGVATEVASPVVQALDLTARVAGKERSR